MENKCVGTSNVVQLEPFIHQVGGHSSMLSLDAGTVCKPLIKRELKFYQTMPESIRKFAPSFNGVIQVTIEQQDEDGYVTLIATPPEFYRPRSASANARMSRIKLKKSGSVEFEGGKGEIFEDEQISKKRNIGCVSGGGITARRLSASHNPWSIRCHKDNLQSLLGSDTKSRLQNFILLENLTSRFSLPCILDLKMGTRQYGDLATPTKRQSKMKKEANTTSCKLGLRLGGMQVYQVNTKHYLCRNKFHGRELTVKDFQQTIYQFLHNGNRLRSDIIPHLIKLLQELCCVLEQQETFRFYTSSLLLLYDGDVGDSSRRNSNKKLDKQCTHKTCIDTLGRSSSAETMSYVTCKNILERSHSLDPTNSLTDENKIDNDDSITMPLVDVRIIDFAHSTHKGFGDQIQYSGPDQGFLFGLENLISIFQNIETCC